MWHRRHSCSFLQWVSNHIIIISDLYLVVLCIRASNINDSVGELHTFLTLQCAKIHSAIKAVGYDVFTSNHDEAKESVKNVRELTDDLEKQGHIIAHKHEQEVAKLNRNIKALQSREHFLLKRNTENLSEASALKRSIFDDNFDVAAISTPSTPKPSVL